MSNLTDFFRTVGHTTKFLIHKKCPEKKSAAENFKDISWIQTQLATIFPQFSTSFRKKKNSPCGLPANLHPETLSKWLFPQGWNPTDTEVGPRHPEKKSQLHGEWWTVSWIYPPPQDAIVTTVHSQFSHDSTVKSIWSMCILDLHPHPGCWLVTTRNLKHFEVRESQLLNQSVKVPLLLSGGG